MKEKTAVLLEFKMARVWTIHHENSALTVRLIPGTNSVSAEQWEAIKDRPPVLKLIAKGELVVIKATVNQAGLGEMKEPEAIAIINKTFDTELLKMWAKEEERGKVLDAIGSQMKLILDDPNKKYTKEELEKMERGELVELAKKYNIEKPTQTKSEDLIEAILEKVQK